MLVILIVSAEACFTERVCGAVVCSVPCVQFRWEGNLLSACPIHDALEDVVRVSGVVQAAMHCTTLYIHSLVLCGASEAGLPVAMHACVGRLNELQEHPRTSRASALSVRHTMLHNTPTVDKDSVDRRFLVRVALPGLKFNAT